MNHTATDHFIHLCLSSTAFHYLIFLSLLSTSQPKNQVQSRLFLDVVVTQGSSILQLLTSEDKSLLVWWDTLLVLDLRLDIVDGVARLDLEGDGLTSKSLDKDLHTTT